MSNTDPAIRAMCAGIDLILRDTSRDPDRLAVPLSPAVETVATEICKCCGEITDEFDDDDEPECRNCKWAAKVDAELRREADELRADFMLRTKESRR